MSSFARDLWTLSQAPKFYAKTAEGRSVLLPSLFPPSRSLFITSQESTILSSHLAATMSNPSQETLPQMPPHLAERLQHDQEQFEKQLSLFIYNDEESALHADPPHPPPVSCASHSREGRPLFRRAPHFLFFLPDPSLVVLPVSLKINSPNLSLLPRNATNKSCRRNRWTHTKKLPVYVARFDFLSRELRARSRVVLRLTSRFFSRSTGDGDRSESRIETRGQRSRENPPQRRRQAHSFGIVRRSQVTHLLPSFSLVEKDSR